MKSFKLMKGVLACLLSLALVISCFNGIGAKAEEAATAAKPELVTATYIPTTDSVHVAGNAYIYVVKSEKGNTVKDSDASTKATSAKDVKLADLGVKDGTAAYLVVVDKEFGEKTDNVDANLVINAPQAKKITGKINYTKADDATATDVLSASAVDKSKKDIENPVIYWAAEATGTFAAANTFTGANLAKMLEAGGTIYIKMIGTEAAPYYRTSKPVKVKVAKQAKAATAKLDVAKETVSIKNGFDFIGVELGEDGKTYKPDFDNVYTVLPYLKTTANKTTTITDSYVPADKKSEVVKDENNTSFTSTKVKGINVIEMLTYLYGVIDEETGIKTLEDNTYRFAIRKSATDQKPASAYTIYTVTTKAHEPILMTVDKTGDKLLASAEKFQFIAPEMSAYAPAADESKFGKDFKLNTSDASADKAGSSFEFIVVKQADLNDIDWSTAKWSKLVPGKTKITDKTKSKYCKVGSKTKITATVKAGDENGTLENAETLILVRRAGVKGKTIDDCVLSSNYVKTYVIKESSKSFKWFSEEAVGAEAYKYVLNVVAFDPTFEATEEDTNAYKTVVKTYEGYVAKDSNATVIIDALKDGESYANGTATYALTDSKHTVTITKPADDAYTDAKETVVVQATVKIDYAATIKFKATGLTETKTIDDFTGKKVGEAIGTTLTADSFNVAGYSYTFKCGEDEYATLALLQEMVIKDKTVNVEVIYEKIPAKVTLKIGDAEAKELTGYFVGDTIELKVSDITIPAGKEINKVTFNGTEVEVSNDKYSATIPTDLATSATYAIVVTFKDAE